MRTDAKSVKRTAIAEAFPVAGHKMLFLFDYGDEWRLVVEFIEGWPEGAEGPLSQGAQKGR
jgi:hypothetical protein